MSAAATVAAVAAVASAGAAIYNGEQTRKATNTAADKAKASAAQSATQADIETNRANQRSPDSAAMLSDNALAAKGGLGSTLLTGSQGIDPNLLTLGKNTLLGGGGALGG